MDLKKRKWYEKILYVLFLILLVPFALLGILLTVAWIIVLPLFERLIYAHSAYFAATGEKYSFLITRSKRYRICRYIARKRPDLTFLHLADKGDVIVSRDALIFFDVFDRVILNEEAERWTAALSESDEPIDLEGWFEGARESIPAELREGRACRLLALTHIFYEENLERAKASPTFLLYDREWKLGRLLREI